jgi:DNA mismatch repair ATPase MutS
MGRRLLRLWFMRPILNLHVLQDRQDTIGVLMRLPDVMKKMQVHFLRPVMCKGIFLGSIDNVL